ncbi:hypothetical protein VPH35_029373 [Triticum aestivum]
MRVPLPLTRSPACAGRSGGPRAAWLLPPCRSSAARAAGLVRLLLRDASLAAPCSQSLQLSFLLLFDILRTCILIHLFFAWMDASVRTATCDSMFRTSIWTIINQFITLIVPSPVLPFLAAAAPSAFAACRCSSSL